MSLLFGVLGPLHVLDATGSSLPLRGSRRRALLLRLVIDANRVVTAEQLVDAIWNGDPPSGANGTLQSHVSLLRRLIGSHLQSEAPGYLLRLAPEALDAAVFESEVHRARGHLARHRAEEALHTLTAALGRWRGPALLDVAERWWAQAEATRLEQLRLEAVEARVEALLRLDRNSEAASAAEQAVEESPLREQLWAQLMVSLHRQGRQADALRAFQRLRRQLADDLGIEPSAAVVALEEAILLQRELPQPWVPGSAPPTGAAVKIAEPAEPADLAPGAEPPSWGYLGADGLSTEPFVGRAAELARIEAVADEARWTQQPQILAVIGPPGIGKTTLVGESLRRLERLGYLSRYGRCDKLLGPRIVAEGEPPQQLGSTVPSEGAERGEALGAALAARLREVAGDRPAVVCLDDVHHADDPMADVLRQFLARSTGALLVLLVFRPGFVGSDSWLAQLLRSLRGRGACLAVEGFDEAELVELAEQLSSVSWSPAADLAGPLADDTAGHPLFAAELLRRGAEGRDPAFHDRLRDVVLEWCTPLGEDGRRVLITAAVMGDSFELRLLAEVYDKPEADVLALLEQGCTIGLVSDEGRGRFRFSSPMTRRILSSLLSATRRGRIHDRIAVTMARYLREDKIQRDALAVSDHWLAGARAVDPRVALDWVLRSARAAMRYRDVELSAQSFGIAAGLAGRVDGITPREAAAIQVELAEAKGRAAHPVHRRWRRTVLRSARGAADGRLVARAVLAAPPPSFLRAEPAGAETIHAVGEALDNLPASETVMRAQLLSRLAALSVWTTSLEQRTALVDEALELISEATVRSIVMRVLSDAQHGLTSPTTLARRAKLSEIAISTSEIGVPVDVMATALLNRFAIESEQGAGVAADASLNRLVDHTVADEAPGALASAQRAKAWRLLASGDGAGGRRALRALQPRVDQAETGERTLTDHGLATSLLRHEGDWSRLRWQTEAALLAHPGLAVLHAARALTAIRTGDLATGHRLFGRAAGRGFSLPFGPDWLSAQLLWAEAAIALGLEEPAALLLHQLDPFVGQFDVSVLGFATGSVGTTVAALAGITGRFDEAEARFRVAVDELVRARQPYEQARTHTLWGQMVRSSGRAGAVDEAAGHGRRALELAAGHPEWSLVADARRLVDRAP